jgi:hypothetical protein
MIRIIIRSQIQNPQTLVNELEFKSFRRRGRVKLAFPKSSLGKAAHQTLQ